MAAGENGIQGTILRALRGNSTSLTLDNTKITVFSPAIARLTSLVKLSAKNNHLGSDCDDTEILQPLQKLTTLNLGGNNYTFLPVCLSLLPSLTIVHLFNNQISDLTDDYSTLDGLQQLIVLNLNNNLIEEVPTSIAKLKCLSVLNIANNKLVHVPREIGHLLCLTELHLEGNLLEQIPYDIGRLRKLQKLYLQKNKLKSLFPSINYCKSLDTLDVSCNLIQLFPKEISEVKLKEFHYELNPLIPFVPIPSSLFEEVMTLKELIIRRLIKLLENDKVLESAVQSLPEVKELLSHIGKCLICNGPFVNTWLECVKFVPVKKLFPQLQSTPVGKGVIPLRAILCSYECFNKEDSHEYYGIATPPVATK